MAQKQRCLRLHQLAVGDSRGNCEVCEQPTATRYELVVGSHRTLICPTCKATLRRDIEKIDKQFEGY